MAEQNAPSRPLAPPLTPKARKKGIQIKTSPAPESSRAAAASESAFARNLNHNLSKLITPNKRHKAEVSLLESQVENHIRLQDPDPSPAAPAAVRPSERENEQRARRRAEARLSSQSARSASPHPTRAHQEPRRALAPLNARVADSVERAYGDRDRLIDRRPSSSGPPGPSYQTLATPSSTSKPPRPSHAVFSLPSRSYRPAPASDSSHSHPHSQQTSPRSHLAELPALTSGSSSSVNTPLPTPSHTLSELAFAEAFERANAQSSTRKRLSALFGIPIPKKSRPSLDLGGSMRGRDREPHADSGLGLGLGLARKGSTRAKVMMVTSILPDHAHPNLAPGPSSYPSTTTNSALKEAAGRAPSPYSAVSHSSASSARKVTPISTVSKASAGRVAFAGDRDRERERERDRERERERERERVARRHISRPMDASNSSASSHHSHTHSHAHAHGSHSQRVSTDGTGRLSVDTANAGAGGQRRSQISSRGRVSHGTFSFEKPAVAPLPRAPPPFGSSLAPVHATFRPGTGTGATSVSVPASPQDARFGSTRSRGRMSLDERRPRLDSTGTDEKAAAGLARTTSLRSARSVGRGEKGSEKDGEGRTTKEKTSCSSLGRLWLQKTKEVLCAARPASQASTIVIPPPSHPHPHSQPHSQSRSHSRSQHRGDQREREREQAEPSSAPPNATSFDRRRRVAVTAQLPAFAFEPAVRAATPESARSRGTGGSSQRDREVVFKVPEIPAHRLARRDDPNSNNYAAFCADLRRVVGDDAFVVFEKYVRQYEAQVFPLLGPRGLVERLKKLLDLSHAGEERKRALVDRFLALARDAEAR